MNQRYLKKDIQKMVNINMINNFSKIQNYQIKKIKNMEKFKLNFSRINNRKKNS